jgi:hypothetical protein
VTSCGPSFLQPDRDRWAARLRRHGVEPAPLPLHRFSEPAECRRLLEAAGYVDVDVVEEQLGYDTTPAERWRDVEAGMEGLPLARLEPALRARLREEHLAELEAAAAGGRLPRRRAGAVLGGSRALTDGGRVAPRPRACEALRMAPAAHVPSAAVIVKSDYLALVGALLPPIGGAIALAGALGILPDRHRSVDEARFVASAIPVEVATLFALGFVVAGAALLGWRLTKIRAAFAAGLRVPGRITSLRPFKDRAYVKYAYVVQGNEHEVRHFVHQTAAYRALEVGQAVTVAVDPRRPRDGFVTALFEA